MVKKLTLGDIKQRGRKIYNEAIALYFDQMVKFYCAYCIKRRDGISHGDVWQIVRGEFRRLWSIRKKIRKPSVPIEAWLHNQVRLRCLNEIAKSRRTDSVEVFENSSSLEDTFMSSPLQQLERKEAIALVRKAVENSLIPKEKLIVERRYFANKQVKEIAQELEVSPAYISQSLRISREKLGRYLHNIGYPAIVAMLTALGNI